MTFRAPYVHGAALEPATTKANPGSIIGGSASVFYHRLKEARHGLGEIAPYGVFDAEPAPGFNRSVETLVAPEIYTTTRRRFPVLVIEDRSADQRHIAFLARRPLSKLLFNRKALDTMVARRVAEGDAAGTRSGGGTVPALHRKRITVYSFHLPVLPQFGCVVRRHTGERRRLGFEMTTSSIELAAPAALVHAAIGLEPDIADVITF
jgi:hypothetical protein